ncbi:MAG TPA: hypothetical protein VK166_16545 [Chitinophagaceae bacterium]|nr:hypothetical protein [Chitinophagaceae bacterium]
MMKRLTVFLIFTFTFLLSYAQPAATTVKFQALEMGRAMVAGDSKGFAKYMLPELVAYGGGAEKVTQMMDSMFAIFKTFGGEVKKITYGNPGKIIKFNKELQTTLPQTTEVSSSIADVILTSTLVAISRDKGKNWYFFDPAMNKADQLKGKLPPISPEIVVPPPQPKFIPKEQ